MASLSPISKQTANPFLLSISPGPGSDVVPTAVSGNVGPVHRYDKMVLQWYPDTVVEGIGLYCLSESESIKSCRLLNRDHN